ncbi:MAG: aminoacyl--tRNA ligase-related protein [Patescibacteria group bacterium]
MLFSNFPIKTLRKAPKDEQSLNAKLLIRASFIDKIASGIYSFLPLGLIVLKNIEQIVREEMEKIKGREILMPALHPKENWKKSNRWDNFDALYKIKTKSNVEYVLGPTHEEIIVPLVKNLISSYRDLPLYLYQIQTKFRDELRAKSGLLRGKEFLMKDLYSFHKDARDLEKYYDKVKIAYKNIFERLNLNALLTEASGGTFSKLSHEFQVITKSGEDIIFYCDCGFARNKEIIKNIKKCPDCDKKLNQSNAVEAGNIFKLNTKYSDPFKLTFINEKGDIKPVYMGCFGIGITRIMGIIVEIYNDEKGIIWPESVAPFKAHIIELGNSKKEAEKVYNELKKQGIKVLYDDRKISAGEKLADADLIGIPYRIVISEKTIKQNKLELKIRSKDNVEMVTIEKLIHLMNK